MTSGKESISLLISGTTLSPSGTAKVPLGQKSFWTSTINKAFIKTSSFLSAAFRVSLDELASQIHQLLAGAHLVGMGILETLVFGRKLGQSFLGVSRGLLDRQLCYCFTTFHY